MAEAALEHDHLLEDGESETSFSSPEKAYDQTGRTTLLDLSLSLNEQDAQKEKSSNDAKGTERKISKTGKEIMKNAIDIDSPDGDKKPEVSQPNKKPGLKKSQSYGAPSNVNYVTPKQKFKHSLSVNPAHDKNSKGLNIAVFLKEGTGHLLCLENGKQTTAGEIKQIMMDVLSIPHDCKDLFAVWLISPLLELQLKGQHVPFKLRRQWKNLLKRFTWAKDEEISKDEPVMVFQRNSFLSVADERKVTNDKAIRRLFEEAKLNVLKGRYRIANADAEMLGGILACIAHGKFDGEKHTIGFFKRSLDNFLPQSAIKRQWLSKKLNRNAVEQHLITQYSLASERTDDPNKFYRIFLEFCWTLPFYGAAFFKGQVEPVSHDHQIWKSRSMNISIGIGRGGITIFRENKSEILLNLMYDELSWDYSQCSEEAGTDSFCIEYDTVANDGKHIASQLQIFSPQAAMMDALVDSCVAEMNRLKIPKSPLSPVFMEDGKPLADQGPPQLKKDQKKSSFSMGSAFKHK
ncbi:putative FERM domain-containing protein FRMD8P1 isoform X2 [Rhopilema esculentum]